MMLELEAPTRCPICSFEEKQFPVIEQHTEVFQSRAWPYTIHQCTLCQSQFAWPRKAAPSEWYAERGEYYGWRWEFDLFLEAVSRERASGRFGGRPRVLEIGCGEGILLHRLQPWAEVMGIELNREAAELGRARGLTILSTNLCEFCERHPGVTFDCVVMFQVLEHLEQPDLVLRQLRGMLGVGGWLFLSTPNSHRYMARIKREAWDYPPHHLIRFSKAGLTKLLERSGLDVLHLDTSPIGLADVNAATHGLYRLVPLPRWIRHLLKLPILFMLWPVGCWRCLAGEGKTFFVGAMRSG
jgi:SAM-dependent methyltransferase